MAEDIPYNKTFDLAPDTVDEVAPGVRRVMANNPGPFTFKGTVSYIIGKGKVAIVDPGPDDPVHVAALLDAVRNETVTHIFVTHTHRDHSPAVPAIKHATGATVYAEGVHRAARPLHIGEMNPLDSAGDRNFVPDVYLKDGEIVEGDGWAVEGVTTPGHTANHMAFAVKGANTLFAGDHVMAWATSIVAPPDGAMSDYMASLRKLAARPEQPLAFTTRRVVPVATAADGRNYFEVEAALDARAEGLRPGLSGVAKIEVGRRALGWLLFHRAVAWMRLALWSVAL